MAKTPVRKSLKKGPKAVVASVNSSTKRKPTNKPKLKRGKSPAVGDAPCSCCPDCVGKASGTLGACEDDGCRTIPPPQGIGPWVLFWKTEVNGNFPYWEAVTNLANAMSAEIQTQLSGMLDAFRTELLAEVDNRINQAIAMSCGGAQQSAM